MSGLIQNTSVAAALRDSSTAAHQAARHIPAAFFTRYRVTVDLVTRLDSEGEGCKVCCLEGHVVEVQAYGDAGEVFGQRVHLECCGFCLPAAVSAEGFGKGDALVIELAL